MPTFEPLEVRNNLCTYRPRGKHSLVDAVDLVSRAITYCRKLGANLLLVDATGLVELPIPTLVDRFLMVEDWALQAEGTVTVAMVVPAEYIHPRKFGVKVALHFGLICDVFTSEEDASRWLLVPSIKFDVFGTLMAVERHAGAWQVFLLLGDGKRSPANVFIPDFVAEAELAQYLDDLFHEAARPHHLSVVRLPDQGGAMADGRGGEDQGKGGVIA
jgi:hypothetical protein